LVALHEKKMVQWVTKGSELVHVDPDLGPGEKRVIAVFQDESCFHVMSTNRMPGAHRDSDSCGH
jgi:hypothetical protein